METDSKTKHASPNPDSLLPCIVAVAIAIAGILLAPRLPDWLVSIVALVYVIGFFFFSLWALRRFWCGVAVTVFLFLLGFAVYCPSGRTKPRPDIVDDQTARWLAVVDNAMGSFFMSRGGYDDFDSKTEPNAFTVARLALPEVPTNMSMSVSGPNFTTHLAATSSVESANFAGEAPPSLLVTATLPSAPREGKNALSFWRKAQDFFGKLWVYYYFHALCYAYGLALLCTIFGRRLVNLLCLFRDAWPPRRRKRLSVFWDVGEESLTAATHERENGGKVVFVFRAQMPFSIRRDPTPEESVLDNLFIPWVYVPPQRLATAKAFSKLVVRGLLKARRHYFLSPDGQSNVSTAEELVEFSKKEGIALSGSKCNAPAGIAAASSFFIRIDADAEEDVLFRWADKIVGGDGEKDKSGAREETAGKATCGAPEIVLVHEPSQVASGLLRKHPMLDAPGIAVDEKDCSVKGRFRVLLIGHGAQGKALLREMVQSAVFPGADNSLEVTVVDASAGAFEPFRSFLEGFCLKDVHGSLLRDSDGNAMYDDSKIDNSDAGDPTFPVQFRFVETDVRSGSFWNWIRAEVAKPHGAEKFPWNRVVLALPDDLENLRLAMGLEREYKAAELFDDLGCEWRRPVFFAGVRRPANVRYSQDLLARENNDSWVRSFGNLEDLYKNLRGNMEERDRGAVAINGQYKGDGETAEQSWEKCAFFYKESSRAALSGMLKSARLLGYWPEEAEAAMPMSSGQSVAIRAKDLPPPDSTQLDMLAKVEQLRYNAYHMLRRISPWLAIVDKVADEGRKRHETVKPNDIDRHFRHAAIVPTRKLEGVDKTFADGNKKAGLPPPRKVSAINENFAKNFKIFLDEAGWNLRPAGKASLDPDSTANSGTP